MRSGPLAAIAEVPAAWNDDGLIMVLEAFPSSRAFAGLLRNRIEPQSGMREALVP